MISKIKKYLPNVLKIIIIDFFNRPILNFYKRNYDKKVLISYITDPFKKNNLAHSNYYEVTSAAKVFDQLGFAVDIIHYNGKIPKLEKYDVIYGFGDVFQSYFESGLVGKKTIYYGTGMHVSHQNTASLNRVKDVYEKKNVWLAKSARFVEKTWTHQTLLVDGIIALGNERCSETYRKYYNGFLKNLPAPFYKTLLAEQVVKNRHALAEKSFLWFGSSGLIHKGLDLCLEYFITRSDLQLHICGNIFSEPDFVNAYKAELFHTSNIHVHGFVRIDSSKFVEILEKCNFLIFPSCSEGGGVSVLTAVGNGGLIPIISEETSVSTGYEIKIEQLNFAGIEKAVLQALALTPVEVVDLQLMNINYVRDNHNQTIYYERLKDLIKEILN